MNKAVFIFLIAFFSVCAQAAVYSAGEVYSYSFETLQYQGVAQDGVYYNFATTNVSPVVVFPEGAWAPSSTLELRLYENSDGTGSPFNTYQHADGLFLAHLVGVMGLDWPVGTWSDLNGRIEIEILTGSFDITLVGVTIESAGLVYSSVPSVPVPGTAWLLGSALLGTGLTRKCVARRKAVSDLL